MTSETEETQTESTKGSVIETEDLSTIDMISVRNSQSTDSLSSLVQDFKNTMVTPQEVATEDIDHIADVYDLPFYHGNLTNKETKINLKKKGEFLLRQTLFQETDMLVHCISIRTGKEEVRNFLVNGSDEGKFYFQTIQANTVTELIQIHRSSATPLSEMSQTVILRPVLRPEWMLDGDKLTWIKKLGKGPLGICDRGTFKDGKRERNIIMQVVEDPDDFRYAFKLARTWRGENYRKSVVKLLGVVNIVRPMLILEIRPGTSFRRFVSCFRQMEKLVIGPKRTVRMKAPSM